MRRSKGGESEDLERLTRKAEDYLEAILKITDEKGYARVKDLTAALGVKPSSVVTMMEKLDESGYVIHKKYDGIILTERGRKIGEAIWYKHQAIRDFLKMINIPPEIADKDACVMEHNLHPMTVKQIKNLVEFVRTAPDNPRWLDHFRHFCVTGEHQCLDGDGHKATHTRAER